MDQIVDNFLNIKNWHIEVIISFFVMLIVIVLSLIVFVLAKKNDPDRFERRKEKYEEQLKLLKEKLNNESDNKRRIEIEHGIHKIDEKLDSKYTPHGLVMLVCWAVEKLDAFVYANMGSGFENMGGYFLGVISFMFGCYIFGAIGLPSPMTYYAIPLSLGLVMFVLIHITSARYTHWKYFKRYVDPVFLFLPINLLSMWAPLISTSLRLFGNAISGWVMMTLIYWGLGNLSEMLFSALGEAGIMLIAPIITPALHLFFDVLSSSIQVLVFVYLSSLFIGKEKPEDEIEQALVPARKQN